MRMDDNLQKYSPDTQVEIATFYRFVELPDFETVAARLRGSAEAGGLLGTVIVAAEGINATLAGKSATLRGWLGELTQDPRFRDLRPRYSRAQCTPFYRLKVRVRDEIVTFGQPGIAPHRRTGVHVDANKWDELLADPEVLVLDARNRYETGIGTFAGAVDPQTDSFRDFSGYVQRNLDASRQRKVAMFCTGGVRCEKASAWMIEQGFEEVYQLSGGILAYLEQRTADSGRWQGACFLFDQRVAVEYGLKDCDLQLCHGCRRPLSEEERRMPGYEEGVSCLHCINMLTDSRRESLRERHRQELLARERGQRHIGRRDAWK